MDRWSLGNHQRWGRWIPIVLALLLVGAWLLIPWIAAQAKETRANERVSAPDLEQRLAPAQNELTITQTVGGSARIDESLFFTISLRSLDVPITGPVTVVNLFPAGLKDPVPATNPEWTPVSQTGGFAWVYTPTIAIQPGTPLPAIVFSGVVIEAGAPTFTNTVTASYSVSNTLQQATSTIIVTVESADLELTKSHTPAAPGEGQQVVYSLNLKNNGPSPATTISVLDKLPTTITYAASQTASGSYDPTSGIWQLSGPLAANASATLRITATIPTAARGSVITNTATIQNSTPFDYEPANDSDQAVFTVATTQLTGLVQNAKTNANIGGATVRVVDGSGNTTTTQTNAQGRYTFLDTDTQPLMPGVATLTATHPDYYTRTVTATLRSGETTTRDILLPTSDLAITITDGRTTVIPNETLNYNITILNIGTITATNVVFTSTLDSLLTYSSINAGDARITQTHNTAQTRAWILADDLAPGAEIDATLVARVSAAPPAGTNTITHTVVTQSDSREAVLTNNSATDTNTNATTGTATLTIAKDASPATVRQNQNITFNIEIRNTGNLAATNVSLTDQLPTLLSLVSAQTTKGNATANTSTRTASVSIGTMNPNETVRVTIIGRVRTSVSANTTQTNIANLSYRSDTTNRTASDSVNFTVAPNSTLPNTGGRERPAQAAAADSGSYAVLAAMAVGIALLLGGLGVSALVFGHRQRIQDPAWAGWYRKTGMLLVVVGLVFAVVGGGLWTGGGRADNLQAVRPAAPEAGANLPGPVNTATAIPTLSAALIQPTIRPPQPTPTLIETLPDYPIPTPTLPPTQSAQEQTPDTSAVNRILVPDLGLDTIVKYVPYDGTTWKIAGLREEVAWLGNTSWPGLGSNTALAAHVSLIDGSDGPFRYLHELGPGALIRVYTEQNAYVYRLIEKRVVSDGDLGVVAPSDQPLLTLITCTGWDEELERYLQRIILVAELQEITPLNRQASLH